MNQKRNVLESYNGQAHVMIKIYNVTKEISSMNVGRKKPLRPSPKYIDIM